MLPQPNKEKDGSSVSGGQHPGEANATEGVAVPDEQDVCDDHAVGAVGSQ